MVQAQTITTDAGAQGLASRLCGNEGEVTRRLRLVEALIGVVAQQSMDLVEARDDVDYHNRQGRHSEQRTFEAAEALGRLQAEVDLTVGTLGAIHNSLQTLLDDLRLSGQRCESEPRQVELVRTNDRRVTVSTDCVASIEEAPVQSGRDTCYVQPRWLGEDACYLAFGSHDDVRRLLWGDPGLTLEPTDTADVTGPAEDVSIAGDGGREGTL